MAEEWVAGKATKEYLERMDKRMRVDDGFIVIQTGSNEYEIPLNECKTPEGVLRWVYHLTEKPWITVEDLRYFIDLVRESSE